MQYLPIYLHDIAILEAQDMSFKVEADTQFRIAQLTAMDHDAILRTHASLGHRIAEQRIGMRFANGLQFFQLWCGDQLAGSTWVVAGGARYVDEVNWLLPIAESELWVRDVFISPQFRGKRLFSHFFRLIAEQHRPACSRVWSDIDWDNAGSLRAHAAAGFEVRARVRSIDFKGAIRWRSRLPEWPAKVQEIAPQRRLVWLRGPLLDRHKGLIA